MTTELERKRDYDYARLPDDGKRSEILDGALYVTPAPSSLHQRVSKRAQRKLDLLLVTNRGQVSGRGIEGAPLLVVEVLSASTRCRDREVRIRRYAALAIAHYWIVDPEARGIACYRWDGSAYRQAQAGEGDTSLVRPDWPDLTVSLAELWR